MITAGLKKGDKFEDAGRYFVIEKVLKDGNYISREITAEEHEKPKKKKKTDEVSAQKDETDVKDDEKYEADVKDDEKDEADAKNDKADDSDEKETDKE